MAIDFKTLLVPLYEQFTAPWRAWRLRQLADQRRAPIVVFFYHRIADDSRVPWTLSNRAFRQQMAWLRDHCDLVSLAEAERRMREGNPRPAAHVTFDDGYAENLDEAIPLLVEWGIPCTYFVTLDPVRTGAPFPHDARLGQRLRPNSLSELRGMADAGIEIGAHTRTHVDLGRSLPESRLHDEIVVSADELEQRIGKPIRCFAFPFGHPQHISAAALRIATSGRFEAIVSAYGGYNIPPAPPAPVIHFVRFGADPRFPRFRNVARYDPRKAWTGKRLPEIRPGSSAARVDGVAGRAEENAENNVQEVPV